MKIILSPAKKMIRDIDSIEPVGLPEFIDQTTEILTNLDIMIWQQCCYLKGSQFLSLIEEK